MSDKVSKNQVASSSQQLKVQFWIESDATFGRGDGIPGLVDRDVALDEYGCPYLHGRTLKGLLNEVCADILFALKPHITHADWKEAADQLWGVPGSGMQEQGILRIGHAQLPEALHAAIRYEVACHRQDRATGWTPQEVTASLTTVRRQTALEVGGAPDPATLRSLRVILRQTHFTAPITLMRKLNESEQALLAACVMGLRRAGTGRNRGRGRLRVTLTDGQASPLTEAWYAIFKTKAGAA